MKTKCFISFLLCLGLLTSCSKPKNDTPPVVPPAPDPEPVPEAVSWTWTFSYEKGTEEENAALEAKQPRWAEEWILTSDSDPTAYIGFVEDEEKTATAASSFIFKDGHPYVKGVYYKDYYLASVPVKEMPAGAEVSFSGSMAGSGSSAGFFLAEYSVDGGTSWQMAEGTRQMEIGGNAFSYHSAPQDSFAAGDGDFSAFFTLPSDLKDKRLLVRLIASPNYRITRPNETNTITTTGGGATRLRGTYTLSLTPQSGEHPSDFEVNKESLSFPGSNYAPEAVLIRTYGEGASVTAEGLSWLAEDPSMQIAASSSATLYLTPSGANVRGVRSGKLIVTSESGRKLEIPVEQDGLDPSEEGFPAKWEISGSYYTEATVAGQRWINEGISTATAGSGKGYITTVSESGLEHRHFLTGNTLAVDGMGSGDYILWSIPTRHLSAGTDVDFMLTLDVLSGNSPAHWAFEYRDGETWKGAGEFRTKYFEDANHTTFIKTFSLSQDLENDFVQVRCRIKDEGDVSGGIYFPRMTFMSSYLISYEDAPEAEDKGTLMALGNSFTYYYGSLWMLKEIARREGIQLSMRANLKGGQSFRMHLDNLEFSNEVIEEGGYDYAILQGTSYSAADFARDGFKADDDIYLAAKEIAEKVRRYSPDATIMLEHTWAYATTQGDFKGYDGYDGFDKYLALGTDALMRLIPQFDKVSRIGPAFAVARSEGYSMYYTDAFHPARLGSYLKSCVNYLTLFGRKFGPNPANCGLPEADAARMREIAEQIVFSSPEYSSDAVGGSLEDMTSRDGSGIDWN